MVRQNDATEASWSLRDARSRLGAVVDAARRGRPQLVTRRGAPAVVVVAVEDYARLRALEQQAQPSFIDHLLALPRDDGTLERIEVDLDASEF